jgi:Ca2+-transporting ATPase
VNLQFVIISLPTEVTIQVLVMFVGGAAFQVERLTGLQWGVSIVIGIMALPIGALLRCIPNSWAQAAFVKLRIMKDPNVLPTTDPKADKGDWNAAINTVRDNLGTFAQVRGGRMRSSSIVRRSRLSRKPSKEEKVALYVTFFLSLHSPD